MLEIIINNHCQRREVKSKHNKQINHYKREILRLRIFIDEKPYVLTKTAHFHYYLGQLLMDWLQNSQYGAKFLGRSKEGEGQHINVVMVSHAVTVTKVTSLWFEISPCLSPPN